MIDPNPEMLGPTLSSDGQGSPDLHQSNLPDRSMERCAECRRRKKGCRPIGRNWPDGGKCEECVKAGLDCGPSTRYRAGTETASSPPNDQESSEFVPTRAVIHSTAQWNQIKDSFEIFYIEDKKPLKEVMRIMQRKHGFRASKRQYHGQINKWGLTKYKKSAGPRMATSSNTSSPSTRHAEPTRSSVSSSIDPNSFMKMRPPERPGSLLDGTRNFLSSGLGFRGGPLQNVSSQDPSVQENFVLVARPGEGSVLNYLPLTHAQEIRLVRLLPAQWNDPISIELYVTDLDHADDYEAVSYAWGSEKDTENILVHGMAFQIRKTLHTALRHFRNAVISRTLWIDAICINQEDILERSKQVQLMGKFYSVATRTIAWLGSDTTRSLDAIKFIQTAIEINTIEYLLQVPKSLYLWEAFGDMLKLPWFRRIWTLQEVSFARTCTLHWGISTISWSDFVDAVEMVRSLEGSLQTTYLTPAALGQSGDFFHQLQVSSVMQLVSTSRFTTIRSGDDRAADCRPSLEALLHTYRLSYLTDPRDRIYALLPLSSDWRLEEYRRSSAVAVSAGTPFADTPSSTDTGPERADFTLFVIDYRKSVWKICFEVIELVLRQSDSVDIICRPWAPDWPGLPSWVSTLGRDSFKMAKNGIYTRVNADALVGAPGHVWKPYNACRKPQLGQERFGRAFESGIFAAQGFALCAISYVASVVVEGCVPADWPALAGWDMPDTLPPDQFWRTLVANRDDTGNRPPPLFFARACRWVFNQIVPGEHLNTNEILRKAECPPFVAIFLRRVQSVAWKRRLFTTKEGYIGIGPEQMQAGDNVCILLGCSVPVVLREIADNTRTYNLIGDCYVHGMMDGEACRGDPAFSELWLR